MQLSPISLAITRLGGVRFSPSALFSSGEQGAWYDPSDLTTLFQDSAGTTPVTAVEQPVGLVLDKSKGLVLGAELVTNGDFSNGLTGWTQLSGSFTASGGRAVAANTDSIKRLSNTASSMVAGRWYKITWNQYAGAGTGATNWTIPGVWNGVDNFANGGNYINGEGEKTVYFLAPVSGQFYIYNFEQAVEYDNFSVKELAGNHAYQTTSASRPTLRARYNLLTYSEQFDNVAWTKSGGSITSTSVVAPDGSSTADTFTADGVLAGHYVRQTVTLLANTTYTFSLYAKPSGNDWGYLTVSGTGAGGYSTFNYSTGAVGSLQSGLVSRSITPVGNGWYRAIITLTTGGTVGSNYVEYSTSPTDQIGAIATSGGISTWGAQLVPTAVFPSNTYQRIAAATDYATGAAFPPYLAFDGVDDSLLTNSVDFSATDKMTVWAGVTKSSDAATGTVVQLSSSTATNNGVFGLFAPFNTGASADYAWQSKGTIRVTVNSSVLTGPATSVFTGIGDVSTPLATLRRNAVQAATSAGSQGTGNFGNFALSVGTGSGPLNGNIYSLIIRGAQSTAGQISSTESWVAAKTPLGTI